MSQCTRACANSTSNPSGYALGIWLPVLHAPSCIGTTNPSRTGLNPLSKPSIQPLHFLFCFTSIGSTIPEICPKQCLTLNKAKLRDLIAGIGLVIFLSIWIQNWRFFGLYDLQIWWMTSQTNRAPVLCYGKLCALFQSHQLIKTGVTVQKWPIWAKIDFFVPCDLEIWQMILRNNRAPLLWYFKFCASFRSLLWIQTWDTGWKCPILIKIEGFLSHTTLKFDRWPWKTVGQLIYATSSFVHHFIAICEYKLELQPGNAQFGSKSVIFLSCVTLKFDRWPWKTIGHLFDAASSVVHHFIAIWEFKLELQSGMAKLGLHLC